MFYCQTKERCFGPSFDQSLPIPVFFSFLSEVLLWNSSFTKYFHISFLFLLNYLLFGGLR